MSDRTAADIIMGVRKPGRLPAEMQPGDLRSLTGGAIDPVGNIKTGARQAAEIAGQKAKDAITDLKTISALFSKHGLGFLIPDASIDEMEKEKKKKNRLDTLIQVWK